MALPDESTWQVQHGMALKLRFLNHGYAVNFRDLQDIKVYCCAAMGMSGCAVSPLPTACVVTMSTMGTLWLLRLTCAKTGLGACQAWQMGLQSTVKSKMSIANV